MTSFTLEVGMLLVTLTFSLLAILALGFHVFSAAPGRVENRAFAAFAWLMALWILNDLAFWGFHGPDEDGRGWSKAAFLIAVAMQAAFLRFAHLFPRHEPIPARLAAALAAPALIVVPAILTGRALGEVGFRGGDFRIEFTPWTYVAGAYVYAIFLAGRLRLAVSRAATAEPEVRRQLDLVLGAPTVTGAATTLAIVVLPLCGIYALLPYASLGILFGTVVHAYAALEFRFLAPASVLDRVRLFPVTAKLALATAGACLLTVAVVLVVARAALGPPAAGAGAAWTRALVFGLTAASIPAMGLILVAQRVVTRPLRRITEAALEVAGGRTGVRVPASGQDEVAVLAGAFNDMVERLERDIQMLRDMSEGLLRTERLATAGALAAGVAHEVNNPLAAISSLVQSARGRTDDPRTRELLDQAIREMERIATALRDLLELARPRPAARRPASVGAIVEAAIRILRYDKRFRGVPIEARLAPDLPPIEADPDRLQQVVMNLLLNARDAIERVAGGRIAVSTRAGGPAPAAAAAPAEGENSSVSHASMPDTTLTAQGGATSIEIVVEDTGRGIAKEQLARVFEPFFTTKAPGAGTGLGLAVCRDIVRDHGGRIAIDSEPGKGTRVTVALPLAGPPASAPPPALASAGPERKNEGP